MSVLRSIRDEIARAFGMETFAAWWAEITGGEPVPEWLAAAPVALPPEEAQRLAGLLIAWIQTPDWNASEQYITEHEADLLTDAAEAVMGMLEANPGNEPLGRAALLHRCREVNRRVCGARGARGRRAEELRNATRRASAIRLTAPAYPSFTQPLSRGFRLYGPTIDGRTRTSFS
jgi:hypothetical protein